MPDTFSRQMLTKLFNEFSLQASRWLMVGPDPHDCLGALTQLEADVTAIGWDELRTLADKQFDITLAQNLFDEIRHPLLALENLCALTRSYALWHAPLQGLPEDKARLCWQETGWQTNRTALARMGRAAGFARVEPLVEASGHVWLKAARQWNDYPVGAIPTLVIHSVQRQVSSTNRFPGNQGSVMLSLLIAGLPLDVRRWELRVNVGGFGVQPIYVGAAQSQGFTQIVAPLPPGLTSGKCFVEVWSQQLLSAPYPLENF